ncbi:hypothetical protein OAP11_03000 [Bacteroidia bacterium]|nr:hypothetical protein [Bacteroidia bacterium]
MEEPEKSQKKWPKWYYFAIIIILGATYNLIFVDKPASEEETYAVEENEGISSQDSLQSVIEPEVKTVTTPPAAKKKTTPPAAKKKTISGLYMWNGLETGNFAIFKKNGSCVFGILSKGGYVSSRTEGSYVLEGDKLIVSGLYNPNWDRASKNNGDWVLKSKTSIEKAEGSLGYSWFKQRRFSDLGTKITF